MATDDSGLDQGHLPHRQLGLQSIDHGSTSTWDVPPSTISNQNWNLNKIYGPVHTVNNNSHNYNYNRNINYTINHVAVQDEWAVIQAKISSALRTRHVPEAAYDAQLGLGCMPGTRVKVLSDINAWIKDHMAPQIFWLTGHAGSGKSAIGHTICSLAKDDPDIFLGGSFFCSRSAGSVTQRDIRCIVPTLAQQLARKSPDFSNALAAELSSDPDVLHKHITTQVEHVLEIPLLALKSSCVPILFVIDALDECGGQLSSNGTLDDADSQRILSGMIEALVAFSRSSVKLPVKFLVTSRPETHIRDTPVSDPAFSKVLQLHTVSKDQVTEDIRLYIQTRLTGTTRLRSLFATDHVEALVRWCDGLFIVATTTIRYTFSAGIDNVPERLQALLNGIWDGLDNKATAPLDRMYALILSCATPVSAPKAGKIPAVQRVLASLLASRMTLSVSALADLLEIPKNRLRGLLSHLHAVVHVPEGDEEPGLRTLHASFGDYLLERADRRYLIDRSTGDRALAHGCLHVMERKLHFNISQSRSSYVSNQAIKRNHIDLGLEYACLHWVYHISGLGASFAQGIGLVQRLFSWMPLLAPPPAPSALDETVNTVFRPRFMFWLEVMSVLGQVRRAAAMLIFAAQTLQSTSLSRFLRDANLFVASSQEAIERSAPHIYISALPLAPKDSLIYQEFSPLCAGLIGISLFAIYHHARRLAMSLSGHTSAVNGLEYSPDGRLICSGSSDGTVRIWDTRTGDEALLPLRSGDGPVWSVSFAPSGTKVASGMEAGVVCLWLLVDGQVAPQRLTGHSAAVLSVSFSCNDCRLASGSRDGAVYVWNVETGVRLAALKGHTKPVNVVNFSKDGKFLASGSEDRTVCLWDGVTGQFIRVLAPDPGCPVQSICFSPDGNTIAISWVNNFILCRRETGTGGVALWQGESNIVKSVSFSPDGRRLASADRESVRVTTPSRFGWKTYAITLGNHKSRVNSVAFSPNGLYIGSAADDCTVKVWNADSITDVEQPRPKPYEFGSIAVSPDGSQIVSGCEDGHIRIWDSRSGALKSPPILGHGEYVVCVTISQDGHLIASASEDKSIRLWDLRSGRSIGRPMQFEPRSCGHQISFSPESKWLACASKEDTVCLWDVTTQRPSTIGPLSCSGRPYGVAFSPDGRILAAGCGGGYIHLWQTATGEPTQEPLQANSEDVICIAFSPQCVHIVSGGNDEVLRVWGIGTGAQSLNLYGHTFQISSVTYSPDGGLIVSGSGGSIRLWDATSGALITQLSGHTTTVRCLAFTPDGRSIVSCSEDHSIRLWDLNIALSKSSEIRESSISTLGSATLIDGWLTGPSGELLLWVPDSYRNYLPKPPCRLRIGCGKDAANVNIYVGDDGWYRGETWSSCWQGDE